MGQIETLEQVTLEGTRRLYPPITDPHWLVLRKRRLIFQEWISKLPDGKSLVLDVGGRVQPYRSLLEDRLAGYIATDIRQTPLVNVVSRGEQLPFECDSFDLAICTQVLQYVPEPGILIGEVRRVLRKGGYFFLSVPGACPTDAYEECWRFLPGGLRHLLAGFSAVEIVPEGRSIAGFFRTTNACLNIFVRYPAIRAAYRWTLCPVLNLIGAGLERIAHSPNDQFVVNYSVLAKK